MAQQIINVGAAANDGTGDTLRGAFIKTDENFDELYTNRISGSGTDNYVPRFNGTNALENSIIFDDGSNVGIGTTSPADKLSVAGIIGSYSGASNLKFNPFANNSNKINSTNFLAIQDDTTNAVGIGYNSDTNPGGPSAKLWVNGGIYNSTGLHNVGTGYFGGNVGIGTTSPNRALVVNGGNQEQLVLISTTTRCGIALNPSNTTFSPYIGSTGNDIVLDTFGSEKMRITSTGNVGIGTTNPSEILHLQSSQPVIRFTKTGILNWKAGVISGNNFTINTDSGGGDAFNITTSGNVGIGTTSPSAKLSLFDTSDLWVNISRGSSFVNIGVDATGTFYNTNSNHRFLYNAGSNEAMRITSSGNVGIGTSDPSNYSGYSTLTLDNISSGGLIDLRNNGTSCLRLSADSTTQVSIYGATNVPMIFATNSSERMRITNNGNVGIGTTSPGQKLDVRGNIYTNGTNTNLYLDNGGAGGASLQIGVTGSTSTYINSVDAHPLLLLTSNTERMRITSDGNVLIGTTSPIYGTSAKMQFLFNGLNEYGINFKSTPVQSIPIHFTSSTGTQVGYIFSDATSVAYVSVSDYRLKEDLKSFNGLDLISQINVYDYKWKDQDKRSFGVMAHELQEVIPQASFGEKDGERMQGVDYSLLVPILVQAIQEQQTQIEELKTLINK